MTATVPPEAPPTPPPAEPATRARAPRPRRSTGLPFGHLLATEISLGLLTAAAVFGFGRIFDSWSFLAPLLVVAVAAHVTVAACRRRGLGVGATFLISTVEWFLVVTWLFFVDTTFALVPTGDTISTARFELDRSWASFHTIVAPAPVQTGFLLAGAAAVGGGVFLADWAAFRLWSAREALVPATTLFVFATLLADDRHRVLSAVLMVGTAVAFVLLHRIADLERSDAWVTGGRGRAGRSLVAAGAALALTAVAAGALLAPLLPGVDEPPLVDWRNENGTNNARLLTSPLVDIRSRLVDTSNTELFTVEATAPAYWRIASLDRFDGTQWRLSASTDEQAGGALGNDDGPVPRGDRLQQTYTIQQFESHWLPAAAQAVEFQPADGSVVRYDRETSTLIAESPTSEGSTYEVVSVVSDRSPEQLRSAGQSVPQDLRYASDLPDGFSPTAARLAREVTSGRATHYEQALALQSFFRDSGGFTYSTEVNLGQSSDAIDTFLEERVGYCEQFAGTFAAMARSLGIPARVAVGYTWGEQDPLDPTRFQVFGKNAHAWPEVWLGEYGWVAFEPTPGRGNPSAQDYTGVAPSQDSGETPATTTTTTTAPDASSTTLPTDAAEAADRSGASPPGSDCSWWPRSPTP